MNYITAEILQKTCPSGFNDGHAVKLQQAALHHADAAVVKAALQLLIDGGETEELTEEIIYADYADALALYYTLMGESPALSEQVMVEAIQKEYELPSALLTLILASNPSAAKSPEVQKTLDERTSPLSAYQRMMIDQGLLLLSLKEQKEAQLSMEKGDGDAMVNQALELMSEDENVTVQQMINVALAQTSPEYMYLAAELAYGDGDFALATTILNDIPNHISDKTQTQYHNEYMAAWQIMLDIEQAQQGTITIAQEAALTALSESGSTQATGLALSLLLQYSEYEYSEPLTPSNSGTLRNYSVKDETMAVKQLMVYPNPTSDLLMVNIISPIVTKGELRIMDLQGKEVLVQTVQSTLQNLMLDVSYFAVGKYQLEWTAEGLAPKTISFEIVR